MAGTCEYGDELSGSIKCGELFTTKTLCGYKACTH